MSSARRAAERQAAKNVHIVKNIDLGKLQTSPVPFHQSNTTR